MTRDRRVISLDAGAENPVENEIPQPRHEDRVNTLAKQVRTVYCICVRELTGKEDYGVKPMPKWDGGENSFGTRHQPIWGRVAARILQLDADPVQYIRAQFRVVSNPSQQPKPNQLYNDAAVARWEAYKDNALNNLRNQVSSEINFIRIESMPLIVNLHKTEAEAVQYVLRRRSCSVSPLIRYCVSVDKGLDRLAQVFREHAILQYMFQMANYDSLLGALIPDQLKADAVELKRRLVGQ